MAPCWLIQTVRAGPGGHFWDLVLKSLDRTEVQDHFAGVGHLDCFVHAGVHDDRQGRAALLFGHQSFVFDDVGHEGDRVKIARLVLPGIADDDDDAGAEVLGRLDQVRNDVEPGLEFAYRAFSLECGRPSYREEGRPCCQWLPVDLALSGVTTIQQDLAYVALWTK